MPEDEFLHLKDLRMHYRDFGDASKPVALFSMALPARVLL
jgi:hypothetical protein